MEYKIDLTGDTSAATEGAKALREEGAAARQTSTAIAAMASGARVLDDNTRAAERLASAIRDVARESKAASNAPAFSTATDHDFKRSKWDTSGASASKATEETKKQGDATDRGTKITGKAVEGTKALRGELGSVTSVVKGATVGLLAYSAGLAGIHSLGDLTKMAIGWRATSQLQLLSWKATMDLRRAVRGVDAQPLVRGFTLLEKNLSQSTVTGRALSGILTRGFNSLFGSFEKGAPLLENLFQRGVLGALELEEAWLDLRIAAKPYTDAIEQAIGPTNTFGLKASAAAVGVGVLATGVGAAAGPYIALAGAITASLTALKALDEYTSKKAMEARTPEVANRARATGAFYAREAQLHPEDAETALIAKAYSQTKYGQVGAYGKPDGPGVGGAGQDTGKALGQGMAAGLDGEGSALSEAGKRAIKAVVKGAKDEGEIHSPSALTRREIGRPLGQGAIGGVEDMVPAAQKAGEKLIPDVSGGGGAAPLAGISGSLAFTIEQIGPFHIDAAGTADEIERKVLGLAPELGQRILRTVAMRMGLTLPGVA